VKLRTVRIVLLASLLNVFLAALYGWVNTAYREYQLEQAIQRAEARKRAARIDLGIKERRMRPSDAGMVELERRPYDEVQTKTRALHDVPIAEEQQR
jgi:hypothetical protein